MPVFVCDEHWNLYMTKVPKRVRWATEQLIKKTGSLVKVDKETCQVCMGLFARKMEPVVLCKDHLTEYYMAQPIESLKDPSFTLRFIRAPGSIEEERAECVWCKTGKAPD